MFSTKAKIPQIKKLVGYISDNSHYFEQVKECVRSLHSSRYNIARVKENVLSCTPSSVRSYCIETRPKDANVFGSLSYTKHESVEMDEDEKKEEVFRQNEGRTARWQKLSTGQYSALIKSHLSKGDLKAALNVLNLVKENRDKPTVFMYSLLIRGFALQGDVDQCFKLYNRMKQRSLKPNDAIYTSLINACAISSNSDKGLNYLTSLRASFCKMNYPLNETHYNTMIKAYSWHSKFMEAFELADEMLDKRIKVTSTTYVSLFHAAISDKKSGLRHALVLWHMMRSKKYKPEITHYNLLLRAIRDTKLGTLKADDTIVPTLGNTKIQLSDLDRPNLLNSPPVLSKLLLPLPDSKVNDNEQTSKLLSTNLNDILAENRLILFGGIDYILNDMKNEGIIPNVRTMTILLEILPNSLAAEEALMKYAKKENIPLDVCFYNMLIRRRNFRGSYKDAKNVLSKMQLDNISPDVMTFGVLSLGCNNERDGMELLEQLDSIGYKPNIIILETLLQKGCVQKNLKYVSYLLKYMSINRINPTRHTFEILETFQTLLTKLVNHKSYRHMKDQFEQFVEKYEPWKKRMEDQLAMREKYISKKNR